MWCVVTHCIRCFPKLKETTHSFGIPARHITPFSLWSQEAGRGSVAELSRLTPSPSFVPGWPLRALCRTFICYLHCYLFVATTTQWWACACPEPRWAQITGSWCRVCTVLMLLLAQRMPTAPPGCARARSRYHHRFVCLREGEGSQRGPSLGWSQQENRLLLAGRAWGGGRSSSSHLGECEAPAKGSSCCAVARMHVAQPALLFQ